MRWNCEEEEKNLCMDVDLQLFSNQLYKHFKNCKMHVTEDSISQYFQTFSISCFFCLGCSFTLIYTLPKHIHFSSIATLTLLPFGSTSFSLSSVLSRNMNSSYSHLAEGPCAEAPSKHKGPHFTASHPDEPPLPGSSQVK